VAQAAETFSVLLRRLRTDAGLTQEELAEAAKLSRRTVSDLERGVATTPQKDTVRLLADALDLIGPARAAFETAARGRALTSGTEAAAVAAMRSLPRDVPSFTGRQRELQQLAEVAAGMDGVVDIHAIGGMAGVGKTAFAVHAAHRLARMFPGGQIFLTLHGHTPGQRPVDPADALASLLLTIGVAAAQIPPGLQARTALWRDRIAGKRLLLVLDDASSSEQVQPLLPGTGGSLVLVTSRRRLSALDDATAISLDTLPPDEAAELLVRLAGRAGLSPADAAVGEITRLCRYLPLAIGIAARQLHHHPAWTAAGQAAELTSARDRLELIATENVSVAAAFDLSYADLAEDEQRLFRRLGLHPGADIDCYAAAALDGVDLATARRGLEVLYDLYLLSEPAQGRYRLHDLLREHARALADRLDPDRDRDAATTRLLDYYQHTASRASALIMRQARPTPASAGGAVPAEAPALADLDEALSWARAERASLLACLDDATRTGQHARVIALTMGIAGLLRRDGPRAEAIPRHTAAVEAARCLGDRLGEANALNDLGDVRWLTGDYPAAAQALEQALALYRELGDRLGQANVLNYLGIVRCLTGDYPAAAQAQEQALALYRELGDRRGQANTLNELGALWYVTGDYPAAAQALDEALIIYRDLGDRRGQANVLNYLGAVRCLTGEYPAAVQAHEQALGICRDIGDPVGHANVLNYLGAAWCLTGDYPAAFRAQEQALGMYRDLGDRRGQANALLELGVVRRLTDDYPAAAQALELALPIFRELGLRGREANALLQLGVVRRLTGDYPAAAQALAEALAIFRDIGQPGGEGQTLNEKGTLHRVLGELALARECHQLALELARTIASPRDEAEALASLGRCAIAAGHATKGRGLLRQASEIFQRIGSPEPQSQDYRRGRTSTSAAYAD
jgi:tetratricopeptide (TPR) repeat protein/transcriptional regulator with XRE-family HTH domain